MNMSIQETLSELKNGKLRDDEFLEVVFDTLSSLNNKDSRFFVKELLSSDWITKYKFNPYVLNAITSKYPLRFEETRHSRRFKFDKWIEPNHINAYCCSIFSTYGQFTFSCKLERNLVCRLMISPRSSVYNFGINVVEPDSFLDLKDVVVLDLETTGLNPLTADVIEIALYNPCNGEEYSRLLPLNRSTEIPNEIEALTGITNDMVSNLPPITSQDLDNLIDKFDLANKKILIWTGINMFDAHFLATLFMQTGNNKFNLLKFVNATEIIKKHSDISFGSLSKDYLAKYLNIKADGSHRALNDCKIETEIYRYLYNRKKQLG